jgi:3-dehydroquinate synthase
MSALSKSTSLSISCSTGTYEVIVANGLFGEMLERHTNFHVIADEFFHSRFASGRSQAIFLPATEHEKSLDRAPQLIEQLRASGATRSTTLLAVGGGVVQDLTAFVASIYMRGLPWYFAPTTVLAMVDSCIGGKSSINVGPYKNLVGTFHPPQRIYIDPSLADTLPRDAFASGLIEAAKICFCHGAESFARYLSFDPSPSMRTNALEEVILTSLTAKKYFVEIDEFDQGARLLLNFGHTFGHAIEGASDYGIPHGIAVGLGILCSLSFQRRRGIGFAEAHTVYRLEQHLRALIKTLPSLPEQITTIDIDHVIKRFASDKKHSPDSFSLILVGAEEAVTLEKFARTRAIEETIRHAIETTLESFRS